MIDPDALLATFDANDDECVNIDRNELIVLIGIHLAESANRFLYSYDICPIHHCDIQICREDADHECEQLRLALSIKMGE